MKKSHLFVSIILVVARLLRRWADILQVIFWSVIQPEQKPNRKSIGMLYG